MKKIVIMFVALILAACGGKSIDGVYVSNLTGEKYTFRSDGTMVIATASNTSRSQKYAIEGDDILIEGTHIGNLKILPNGNISYAAGLLEKQR
ncbi:hypothetical protein [Ralstonia flatus]|uniref:Lipoprotein n=1 Tax=Ralstonia flatus TaxID=3058601 RepID=A0AAD2BZK4_9RALS|nr:hypothetical protein [Ralstonia sp. LMG 32965]CAJ0881402.1 hypothetical protein R77567_03385 [Ralstonia sp. LMG 32965]CAJ0893004.1 hypothetical protein R77564_03676 [Ralstonia sp. LMG 32965]